MRVRRAHSVRQDDDAFVCSSYARSDSARCDRTLDHRAGAITREDSETGMQHEASHACACEAS
jgi:hypothetical protein